MSSRPPCRGWPGFAQDAVVPFGLAVSTIVMIVLGALAMGLLAMV